MNDLRSAIAAAPQKQTMNTIQIDPIALAFRLAFLRALEQWTFDLRAQGSNLRYVVSGCRNEWSVSSGLGLKDWSKPA